MQVALTMLINFHWGYPKQTANPEIFSIDIRYKRFKFEIPSFTHFPSYFLGIKQFFSVDCWFFQYIQESNRGLKVSQA